MKFLYFHSGLSFNLSIFVFSLPHHRQLLLLSLLSSLSLLFCASKAYYRDCRQKSSLSLSLWEMSESSETAAAMLQDIGEAAQALLRHVLTTPVGAIATTSASASASAAVGANYGESRGKPTAAQQKRWENHLFSPFSLLFSLSPTPYHVWSTAALVRKLYREKNAKFLRKKGKEGKRMRSWPLRFLLLPYVYEIAAPSPFWNAFLI